MSWQFADFVLHFSVTVSLLLLLRLVGSAKPFSPSVWGFESCLLAVCFLMFLALIRTLLNCRFEQDPDKDNSFLWRSFFFWHWSNNYRRKKIKNPLQCFIHSFIYMTFSTQHVVAFKMARQWWFLSLLQQFPTCDELCLVPSTVQIPAESFCGSCVRNMRTCSRLLM